MLTNASFVFCFSSRFQKRRMDGNGLHRNSKNNGISPTAWGALMANTYRSKNLPILDPTIIITKVFSALCLWLLLTQIINF